MKIILYSDSCNGRGSSCFGLRLWFIVGLILVTVIGCKQKNEEVTNKLYLLIRDLTHNSNVSLDKTFYLIIPMEGCGYCINKSIDFANHYSGDDFLFIVSHYDKKAVKRRVSNIKDDILADYNFKAASYGLVAGSPVLYIVINQNVDKVIYLDSNNVDEVLNSVATNF